MILADTSVWVDYFSLRPGEAGRHLAGLLQLEAEVCLTGFNVTEILQGISDPGARLRMRGWLTDFPCFLPRGLETYVAAAELFRACAARGRTVRKTLDCLIAAVAAENDLLIFHQDRDFEHLHECAGVKTYRWNPR